MCMCSCMCSCVGACAHVFSSRPPLTALARLRSAFVPLCHSLNMLQLTVLIVPLFPPAAVLFFACCGLSTQSRKRSAAAYDDESSAQDTSDGEDAGSDSDGGYGGRAGAGGRSRSRRGHGDSTAAAAAVARRPRRQAAAKADEGIKVCKKERQGSVCRCGGVRGGYVRGSGRRHSCCQPAPFLAGLYLTLLLSLLVCRCPIPPPALTKTAHL